ncbi:MAG: hypothetical protein ONB16_13070 [candidate division KSB1 bacterium]|nr:hypothetical protein [candidate division KSB1 bacterium]MDZ7319930.1 hypothetical protein [candidate division KSB1 bacterium]MDZ7342476.1 hypothetical protein [candidate division KSB1 bacterium]
MSTTKLVIVMVLLLATATTSHAQWQQWQPLPDMPTARFGHCAVLYHDRVWNIGGKSQLGASLNSVDCYDLKTGQWDSSIPPLIHARFNAAAVVYRDTIFVLGGHNERQILNSVEFFDPVSQNWKEFTPLRRVREGLNAIVFEGKMYAIGGLSLSGLFPAPIDNIEYWDEQDQEWEEEASWHLITPRFLMQSLVVGRYVYTLGGLRFDKDLDVVERFATSIGGEPRRSLPSPRFYFSAVTVQNIIYILGGIRFLDTTSTQRFFTDSIELYEPEQDKWAQFNLRLPAPLAGFTSAVYKDKLYVFGGMDSNLKVLKAASQLGPYPTAVNEMDGAVKLPVQHQLCRNYPNPFNTVTTIHFQVAKAEPDLQLVIFNLLGMPLRRFALHSLAPGEHQLQWDGCDENGRTVAAGVYFAQLVSTDFRSPVLKLSFVK